MSERESPPQTESVSETDRDHHVGQTQQQGLASRWAVRVFVGLLVLHFVLVYTAPEWLMIPDRFGHDGLFQSMAGLIGIEPEPERVFGTSARPGDGTITFMERDGQRWLAGGQSDRDHFLVTQADLVPAQLKYGLGREAFPALIDPQFHTLIEAQNWLGHHEKVLLVEVGGEARIYPVRLLINHEVVNDTVGGTPIFAAYCILADLGAVYSRRVGGHDLTFALSGYTYADPAVWDGLDAFVLWDRDTESLWWPPAGKAVSGPMHGRELPVLDASLWMQTTFGQAIAECPNATVLIPGQDFERPKDWPRLDVQSAVADPSNPTIAPRWGDNPGF